MTQQNNTQNQEPKQDLNKLTPYQMATLGLLSIIALAIFALIFVLLRLPDQSQTQTVAPTPTIYIAPTLQPAIVVKTPTLTNQQMDDKMTSEMHYAPNMQGTIVLMVNPIQETYPFTETPEVDPTKQIQIDAAIEDFKRQLTLTPRPK